MTEQGGTLEQLGPLAWRLTVELPAAELEKGVDDRLAELRRTARVPGFRPGKVPAATLRRRFGERLRREQAERLGQAAVRRQLAVRGLRPVRAPRLSLEGATHAVADFETFPALAAIDLCDLEIEVPQASVGEADVDRMLERLRAERGARPPAADSDAAFVRGLGFPDGRLDTLRRHLAESMARELEEALEAERVAAVEQALLARHPALELPPALLEAQLARLREVASAPAGDPGGLCEEARKLLTITFLFAEVARQRGLAPDPTRLWERTQALAEASADPAAELDRIWRDGERVQELEEELLRQEVAAAVLAAARVSTVELGFSELADRRRARLRS